MYLTDTEIREKLHIAERRWGPAVKHFERQGFPRVDPLVGKRYWPAVENWLLQRYSGMMAVAVPDSDETENWDAYKPRQKRART